MNRFSSFKASLFTVCHMIGALLLIIAVSMLLPICVAILYNEGDAGALSIGAIAAGVPGYLLWRFCGKKHDLNTREALIVASVGWIVIAGVSAIPFVLTGHVPKFTDAFFEMMSGFTTTGGSILPDIEALPHGLLLWRSETHLIGGMGFLTIAAMIVPHGIGGLRLFKAESSPGQTITGERFTARNRDAMVWLWSIYIGLNVIQLLLMWGGGMPLFEATCHTFGTVSTAGYSPLNNSLAHYNGTPNAAYFQWVMSAFMFLGGVSFVLYIALLRGKIKTLIQNTELKAYITLTLMMGAGLTAILYQSGTYNDPLEAIRHAVFQVVSIVTTSGFTSANYDIWPQSAQMLLYLACFTGACAGSTTSGIKVVHFVLIWKYIVSHVKKNFFSPLSLVSIRLDGKRISEKVIIIALCYFIANMVLIFGGAFVLTLIDNVDIETAISAAISCLMNIGPGFGEIGSAGNYAEFSDSSKWFLSFNMLVGRLEMFSALVIFYPSFWRK